MYLVAPSQPKKPYQARMKRGGKQVHLGCFSFATAEEAALCVARSPEGQAVAAERAAAVAPLTSEGARQQAQSEGLTLRVAENQAGYYCVTLKNPGQPKPYQAQVTRAVARRRAWAASPPPRRRRCASPDRRSIRR